MANQVNVRDYDKLMLRLPPGMRERLSEAAKSAGRSLNTEIISRLEDTFVMDDLTLSHDQRIDKLEYQMSEVLGRLGLET